MQKQNLVCTRIQGKGAVTPQENDPDLPMSVEKSLMEVLVGSGLMQGWGTLRVVVCAWDLLKEVTIIFITYTIIWPQVK